MSLPISCHNAQFGTLGQIDPSHLAEIAAQGYKSVINNRPDGEGGPEQPTNASIYSRPSARNGSSLKNFARSYFGFLPLRRTLNKLVPTCFAAPLSKRALSKTCASPSPKKESWFMK